MKRLAAVLALVAGISAADPALIQNDDLTVYEDGAQTFVFSDKRMFEMLKLAKARDKKNPQVYSIGLGDTLNSAGIHFYLARLRPFTDAVRCEKFARRPKSDDLYPAVIAALAALPCS